MTQHRPTSSPVPGTTGDGPEQDRLVDAIGAALRSREPDAAVTEATAQRIAADIAAAGNRNGTVTPFARRASLFALTGVVTSTIVVGGAGAAAAANPYTEFAATVDGVASAVGVRWSSMPDGYTREQYEAFWASDYTSGDLAKLRNLWNVESLEAKARAGQMLIDGRTVPVQPGTVPEADAPERSAYTPEMVEALEESEYTFDDIDQLAELWNVDSGEAKIRLCEMLLDGKTPPPVPHLSTEG